ncbi:aminopeptidase N [Streptomyces violaceorubidus]
MSVLTRDEAQTRARLLDVHHYAIDLDLTRGDETFDSRTVIRFTVRGDTDSTDTFVELKPAELRAVTLDGHPMDPAALAENRLALKNLAPGEHELGVEATMRYSRTGEGMHRFTDPADGETYVYTQLFLDDIQRVFAAFDQPDLKAVFDLTVTAPEGWTVLANGVTEHTGDGRWKAATTPLAARRGPAIADAAGRWAFPAHAVDADTLRLGQECLADADPIPALRRKLADQLDDLARALRVREANTD